MDNQQQINDALRQTAHAELIKEQRRQADLPPEARRDEAMEKMMFAAAERAVQKAFQGFTLQSGNRIRISGTGRNITVAYEDAPAVSGKNDPQTIAGGQWYSLTLCDGTTLDVWASNIVPP